MAAAAETPRGAGAGNLCRSASRHTQLSSCQANGGVAPSMCQPGRGVSELLSNKQQSQAQSDGCRWRSDQLDGAVSFRERLGPLGGDTKPPGGDNP